MLNRKNWKSSEKGLYYIKNLITNQIYIGSTRSTFYRRITGHITALNRDEHANERLQHSYNKYGIENFFVFIKPLKCSDFEILQREENLIKRLKPYYNICQEPTKGGKPNKGRKLSQSWKDNIAEKSKQYKHSEDTLKLVTENNKKGS
jgi:group I intron endonuclease